MDHLARSEAAPTCSVVAGKLLVVWRDRAVDRRILFLRIFSSRYDVFRAQLIIALSNFYSQDHLKLVQDSSLIDSLRCTLLEKPEIVG
jgi:hypothetical protein